MRVDPIRLEIFKNLFHSVAEEMGAALRRSAFSPNIKERRDYSCAVFDAAGQVLAMGDHMPVHLGSMPMSVLAALDAFPLRTGDVALLNDPYAGGTHLPDLTMVMPVFGPRASQAAVLHRQSRTSRRHRRRARRLDGLVARNFRGRPAHSPCENYGKGACLARRHVDSSRERAHPARARRRLDRADRRVPHRRAPA